MTYDTVGNVKARIDTAGRTTNYDYDAANRLIITTDALSQITQFEYNARSQMTKVTDALSQQYVFTYDPLGRQLSQTHAGTTMSYEYDAVGNRKKRTDYIGHVSSYIFDNLNRMTKIDYGIPVGQGTTKQYGYDDISRLTSAVNEAGTVTFGYDNRNREILTTDVFGHTINYEYERTSAVNQRRLKLDGAMYAVYNFDDANRLSNIVNSGDSTTISYGYDNEDKMTSRTYPTGIVTTYDYDNMDRLKELKDVGPTATLFDRNYSYNTANQIAQIVEPSQTRIFGYDNVNRLTGVTNPSATNESYLFDKVGNRTSSHRSNTYGYQPFNKIASTQTATYNSDANGNMTSKSEGSNFWRYGWDYENKLTSASTRKQSVRYVYDALGRRIRRHIPGGKENTKFTYDGEDVLVDDNAGVLTKYQNGPGVDNKLRSTNGSNISYFIGDHLGSTNGLANSSGSLTASNTYDSFGNASNSTFPTRYQFTGREYDSFSGLQYSRARFYDAKVGRFIAEDPIGFEGLDVNWFAYVHNNPMNYFDPEGTQIRAAERWQPGEVDRARELQRYVQSMPDPIDTGRSERLYQCHERNKFSALGSILPYGQGTLELLETGSILSLSADSVAVGRKFMGPRTFSPKASASGINMVSKDIDRAFGFPRIGGSPLGKYYKPVGNFATKGFLFFGVFTFSYNTTVDIQCICGQLE